MAKSKGIMPDYAKKKKGDYPAKLTKEVQEKIVALISKGNYIETAAAFAGISKNTVFDWMKAGRRQPGSIYSDFLSAVEKAQSFAEISDLQRLDDFAKADSKVIMWRLERRFPERWGPKNRHEHTGKDGGPITFVDLIKDLEQSVEKESSDDGADDIDLGSE